MNKDKDLSYKWLDIQLKELKQMNETQSNTLFSVYFGGKNANDRLKRLIQRMDGTKGIIFGGYGLGELPEERFKELEECMKVLATSEMNKLPRVICGQDHPCKMKYCNLQSVRLCAREC